MENPDRHDPRAAQPHPSACATIKLVNDEGHVVECNPDQVAAFEKKGYGKPEPPPPPAPLKKAGATAPPASNGGKGNGKGSKPAPVEELETMPVVKIQAELEQLGVETPPMASREQLVEMLKVARASKG